MLTFDDRGAAAGDLRWCDFFQVGEFVGTVYWHPKPKEPVVIFKEEDTSLTLAELEQLVAKAKTGPKGK
jgi:hypothetical protein